MEEYLVDPFVITEAGNYKFCVRFGADYLNYNYVMFLVEERTVGIEGSTSMVSLVKGDDVTLKNFTFTGAIKYFTNVDVKIVDGTSCTDANVPDVFVPSVTGTIVTVSASSGVESPLHFCVLLGSDYLYMRNPTLAVKELTSLSVEGMTNALMMTQGTYTIEVDGYHVGVDDMLRFVPKNEDCSWTSLLTAPVNSYHQASIVVTTELQHSSYEACYQFKGDEYMKYPNKTLDVYLISSVEPTRFVADVEQETVIRGLGRAVGDRIWFVESECGEIPASAIVVTSLESVMITVTNSSVHYMCYNFQAFGTVRVDIEMIVYDVTSLSHSGWLTVVPLPTSGYSSNGVEGAMVLTGSQFSLNNHVKFVKNSESCTGVSTDPLQIVGIETVGNEQRATLSSIVFPEAGDYYLCIVHDNSNEYLHYDLVVSVEATVVSEVRDDAEMFVLTEDPLVDNFDLTEPFLSYVSGSMSVVWTETTCANYVNVDVSVEKTGSVLAIASTFTRTYNSLSMCLRLPGDIFVSSRIRKVFKVFTTVESPAPFMSEAQRVVSFTILGQNLKVDDRVAFISSTSDCSTVTVADSVLVNSGSVSAVLNADVSDYKVCYQYSEFGESSAFATVGDLVIPIFEVVDAEPKTLVQGKTQTFQLMLKNSKTLPAGFVVRVVPDSESCSMATSSVSAIVSSDSSMEMTPRDDLVFERDNMVCVSRDENSPFFSFNLDVTFARILPIEDPLLLLRSYSNRVLFSNEASLDDAFKFVGEGESCDSSSNQEVLFSLEDTTAVFTLDSGFMNHTLCYNFYQSQGYFAYDDYSVNILPVESSSETLSVEEVSHAFRVVTRDYTNIVTFFNEAMSVSYANTSLIMEGGSVTVLNDLSQSSKVMSVLRLLNIDFNLFARNVVQELETNSSIITFVDAYAHEVMTAYEAGDSDNPQSLLLMMINDFRNTPNAKEKIDAIMEGWRGISESVESSDGSFVFSDGSEVTLSPIVGSRRLQEATQSVKINRYECVMIDMDITEGYCYEVLIDNRVDGRLSSEMVLSYTKRDPEDTHCASKLDIISIGWELRQANVNQNCDFENGKVFVNGTSFGVVSSFVPQTPSTAEIDTTVLTVLLVLAMVIFALLFIGLAYALWVYVHPESPVDVDDLWRDFDKKRKENLENKRKERALRKQKLIQMEQQYVPDMDMDRSDEGEDEEDNFNDRYQAMLSPDGEIDEVTNYQMAIHSVNESGQYAQQVAENTDIFQDDEMLREPDLGEVRRSEDM